MDDQQRKAVDVSVSEVDGEPVITLTFHLWSDKDVSERIEALAETFNARWGKMLVRRAYRYEPERVELTETGGFLYEILQDIL